MYKKIFNLFHIFAFVASMSSLALVGVVTNINVNAQGTNTPIPLKPGQSYTFTVVYENAGDNEVMRNAILEILVGSELSVNTASFTDKFENDPQYPVTPSALSTTNPTSWGNLIRYRPRSATNPNSPSGQTTAGDVTIPLQPQSGAFRFEATLRSDVLTRTNPATGTLYQVGDVLDQDINQGVRSELKFQKISAGGVVTNGNSIAGAASIRILSPDACGNGATNPPTCTCPSGQIEISGACTDIVDSSNIGNCTPAGQVITIGQTATCNFPLTGGTTGNRFALPSDNITAGIETATGNSPSCTITGSGSANPNLVCASIPTTGGEAGQRNILVRVGNETQSIQGNLTLSSEIVCPTEAAGIYPNCSCPGGGVYNQASNSCSCPNGQILEEGSCADIIDSANIGNCVPVSANITIGQTATCNFPLSGGGNNYALPAGGITATIATATGVSPSCTIINNNSANASLQCSGIPSDGATPGQREVLVSAGDATLTPKGTLNLVATTSCPSNASGTFPNCSCPANFTYNSTTNICIDNSCTAATANTPNCRIIAKPDTDTIDNDGNGGDNEPVFTDIIFTPNPAIIGEQLKVKTTGLVNNFNDQPLDQAPCTTFLTGPKNFNVSVNGTVVAGECEVTFSASQVPKEFGTYNAYTQVNGPNGQTLRTPNKSIRFINPALPDTDTIDNDGNGGDNEPAYTDILFNPNPGRTQSQIQITTTGLLSAIDNQPLNEAECKTTFFGAGGYNRTETGTIDNGRCVVIFEDDIAPKVAGTYTAYTEVEGRNGLLRTPTKTVQVVNPARADADSVDNDGVGGDNEPVYTDIIFNPDPAIIGQQLTATTTGLVDDNTGQPLNGSTCTSYLTGNGFNRSKTAEIINGQCLVVFDAAEVPTAAGTYCVYTEVFGADLVLRTRCEDILFTITSITPRTGGEHLMALVVVILIGGASGAGFYYYTRIRRMKIN